MKGTFTGQSVYRSMSPGKGSGVTDQSVYRSMSPGKGSWVTGQSVYRSMSPGKGSGVREHLQASQSTGLSTQARGTGVTGQ